MQHRLSAHAPTLAVALAALFSAAACVRTRTDPVTGKIDIDVESPTKRGEDWKAGIAGGSITGQGRAAVLNGQSTITVNVNGLTAGASHAWRVFEGKCTAAGALVGSAGSYSPITAGADGTAQASARLSVALDEAKDYSIRIYASPTETTTVAACGDLSDSA
jgi:hypothetical protein